MTENRMVAWNGEITNEHGFIWCMVEENTPGYRRMTGSNPLQAPWYLAEFNHHENDFIKTRDAAEKTAASWNKERGYSKRDVMEIVASSMRLSNN